jgi:hypothetical protein
MTEHSKLQYILETISKQANGSPILWKLVLKSVDDFENAQELRTTILKKYSRLRNEITKNEISELSRSLSNTQKILSEASGLFSEHTAAYKAIALAQTTIDTYQASTSALKLPPVGLGPVWGVALAAVTMANGLANVSKIADIKIPKFADGGFVNGPLHSAGGVLLEAEGGEYIINRKSAAGNLDILNAINAGKNLNNTFNIPALYGASDSNGAALLAEIKGLNARLDYHLSNPVPPVITKEAIGKIATQGNSQMRKSRV